MGVLRRLTGPLREFGIGAGLLYIADRLMRAVSPRFGLRVYEMLAQPVAAKPLLPASLTRNLRFGEIREGDAEIDAMPARTDIKRARFAQGARCLGVWKRDALIGYVWFCRERYDEDEARVTYVLADPARGVFDFDLVVVPEHRMGIAFAAIWHGANAWLRERGVTHSFSRMTRFNDASRRAHRALGARCVGRVVFVQAGPLELMASTLAPRLALTWRTTQRVELRLPSPPPIPPVDAAVAAAASTPESASSATR